MKRYNEQECIFSNITSIFGSSIIVVRFSGSKLQISQACSLLNISTLKLKHSRATLCKLYINNTLLDEALVTLFHSPKSFTGEECLEISLHGSKFIFNELSQAFLGAGFRFAQPGEFSYRAFLNNKMDLVKAEGLANLIASESTMQHKAALESFTGKNSSIFNSLREELLDILASIESLIDFGDEDLPASLINNIIHKTDKVKEKIAGYLSNNSVISLNFGLRIAIIGLPNAGKSSFFNCLCKRPKSIVSKIPGTTRDILEEKIILKGMPLIFYDTAGLRNNPSEEIEAEGIRRTKEAITNSDIKLLILDATTPINFHELAMLLDFSIDQNTLFISNKTDIAKNNQGIQVSALTGEGVDQVIKEIETLLEKNFLPLIGGGLLASERQRSLLKKAFEFLGNFHVKTEIELAAEDLRRSIFSLEEIIGKVDTEHVLGNIFSRFCIGK